MVSDENFFMDAETEYLDKFGNCLRIPADMLESSLISVSVVIPCYNYGRFLLDAIASVRQQTLSSIEIIVVDDGSTDPGTITVLDDIQKDESITVLRGKNQGLPSARNRGIEIAKGKFICCLDADDLLAPTYLELCLHTFSQYTNLGFVYSWVQLFGEEVSIWQTRDFSIHEGLRENWTSVAAVFRKADWKLISGYDLRMVGGYEDWEFWIRLARLGRAGIAIPSPLFLHRKHGRTMTTTAKERHDELYNRILDRNAELLKNTSYLQKIHECCIPQKRIQPARSDLGSRLCVKQRVLVVIPWLKDGGAEHLILDILTGLKDTHEFTIVTTVADSHELLPRFNAVTNEIFDLSWVSQPEQFASYIFEISLIRGVNFVMSSGSPMLYIVSPLLKSRNPRIKIIDILHNDSNLGHISSAIKFTESIDCHVCVSRKISDTLVLEIIEKNKIKTIPNGVDTRSTFRFLSREERLRFRKALGIEDDQFVLLFVGRASTEKRPELFVELVRRLRGESIRAVLVSQGPMRSELEAAIKSYALEDRIILIDSVEREKLTEVYGVADILVNTSSVEGMPLTVIEAMAVGCPVAAMSVGNLDQVIVNGENGILVGASMFDALVSEMRKLIPQTVRCDRMRLAARATVEELSLDRNRMILSYGELLR